MDPRDKMLIQLKGTQCGRSGAFSPSSSTWHLGRFLATTLPQQRIIGKCVEVFFGIGLCKKHARCCGDLITPKFLNDWQTFLRSMGKAPLDESSVTIFLETIEQ